jgi:hypothetical protein
MKRKLTFSITLGLSVALLSLTSSNWTVKAKQAGGALAFPGTVAAPKQRCTLEPSGPAAFFGTVGNMPSGASVIDMRASWPATVSCQQPSPLEGQTVEIQQRLAVRIDDNGRVMGRTMLGIDINGDMAPEERFRGRITGSWSTVGDDTTITFDTRAHSRGGTQALIDNSGMVVCWLFSPQAEIMSFTPGTLEVKSGTEFGVILN